MLEKHRIKYLQRLIERQRVRMDKLEVKLGMYKRIVELTKKQRGCRDCPLQIRNTEIMSKDSERIFTPMALALTRTEHAPLDSKE